MLERILDYEHDAFIWLNSHHTPFENQFMWLFSGKVTWIPLVVVFVAALFYKNLKHWKETFLILAAIALVVTLCDQFSSGICKPLFFRFRPTHHPEFMDEVQTVFGYRGGSYGFISSHATNAFGFVTLTALIFRYRFYSIMLCLWATVNSYSRIYLGVHFLSDIIPGIVAGSLFGWLVYRLYLFARKKLFANDAALAGSGEILPSIYARNRIDIILYMLILTIAAMLILSLLSSINLIPAITVK
ncbi:MAG: phosphatase PAP2 family protein [Tannerella sp.]|jgi:undecaprenyl-diphosphatase|nr:phosphatase PAP2 family protein [Tannerella sp.]